MELSERIQYYALEIIRTCTKTELLSEREGVSEKAAEVMDEVSEYYGSTGLVLLVTALGRHGGAAYSIVAERQDGDVDAVLDRVALDVATVQGWSTWLE